MCVSGSNDPPGQFVPPSFPGRPRVASGPSRTLTTAGVNSGPILYREVNLTASARSSGVKSIRSSIEVPCRSYPGGLVGTGCVGEYHSPGASPLGAGRSSIGQTGSPVTRSNTYRKDSLLGTATALIVFPLTLMSARIGADERS